MVMPDGGRVTAVDMADGRRLWTRDVPQTDEPVTIVGDQAVLVTRLGQVLVLDLRTGHTDQSWRLELPLTGERAFVDVPPGLVGQPAGLLRQCRGARQHDPVGLPGRRRRRRPGRRGAGEHRAPVGRQPDRAAERGRRQHGPRNQRDPAEERPGRLLDDAGHEHPGVPARRGRARRHGLRPGRRPAPGDRRRRGLRALAGALRAVRPRRPAVGLGRRRGVRRAGRRTGVGRPRDRSAPAGSPRSTTPSPSSRPCSCPTATSCTAAPAWRGTTGCPATWSGSSRAPTSSGRGWRPTGSVAGTRVRGRRGLWERGLRRRYR